MPRALELTDRALLAAYLLLAALGTATHCLLVNDGAIFLTAVWLGDPWTLYFNQFAGRALALLASFGPAWLLRVAIEPASGVFLALAHIFYFAVPLALWAAIRAIERDRAGSRLYLAAALALVNFPSELAVGAGLWTLWLALIGDPARSMRAVAIATTAFGVALSFTHPVTGLMALLYALVSAVLAAIGHPVARRTMLASGALAAIVLALYAATASWLAPTNPTVVAALARNRSDYVDPLWMTATLLLFPLLAAMWLLLLAPGLVVARRRSGLSVTVVVAIGIAGLWFAVAGTGLLTWLYARHTAVHVLALALALAAAAPQVWLATARLPLLFYAAIMAVSAVSYAADLALFGRFVDSKVRAGTVDVDAAGSGWPARLSGAYGQRSYLKWTAGPDYTRDVVVPMYDWYQVTLAFYSYFRSGRESILFHPLGRPGDWIPFECPAVARVRARPHDERDAMLLGFLAERYCVR